MRPIAWWRRLIDGPAARSFGLLAGLALAGLAAVEWLVPAIIRAVHAGSLPDLGGLMESRGSRPVEGYLAAWKTFGRGAAFAIMTIAVFSGGLLALRLGLQRARPRQAPSASPGEIALLAAWTGLVGGIAAAWYQLIWAYYRGGLVPGISDISQSAAWMTPAAYLLALVLVGGVLAGTRWLLRSRIEPRTLAAALTAVAILSVLMETGWLHWAAATLLSVGVASRLRSALSPGAGELIQMARRTMLPLLLSVVVAGLVVPLLARFREYRQASAAGAPVEGGANILFIVLDTERAASTSLHGAARQTTPFFDGFATRGAWFTRAIAPATYTLPSHAAMFTGRPPEELGVGWHQPLDGRHATLAETLGSFGYVTAGFVANPFFLSDVWGLGRGFGRWDDQPVLPGVIVRHSWLTRAAHGRLAERLPYRQDLGRRTAAALNSSFLAWLDRRQPERFLAFLNYYDPHHPYLPPRSHRLRFSDHQPRFWPNRDLGKADAYNETDREDMLLAYETSIAYLDEQLGRLMDALEARGALANTLVVITSDHGEAFGEAGEMGHGDTPVLPVIHVPLAMVYPGRIPPGTVIEDPVELERIATTVLELAGAGANQLPGRSLVPLLTGDSTQGPETAAFARHGDVVTMVTRDHQLLRWRDGQERLFRYQGDTLLAHDLGGSLQHTSVLDSLRALLAGRFPEWR